MKTIVQIFKELNKPKNKLKLKEKLLAEKKIENKEREVITNEQ